MNFSFAGCGFLGIYHVGVAACLKKYAPNLLVNKTSGASAGSLAAVCLLCDAPLGKCISFVLRVLVVCLLHANLFLWWTGCCLSLRQRWRQWNIDVCWGSCGSHGTPAGTFWWLVAKKGFCECSSVRLSSSCQSCLLLVVYFACQSLLLYQGENCGSSLELMYFVRRPNVAAVYCINVSFR